MSKPTLYSSTAPPVVRTANVSLPPDEAFVVFTEQMGAWWPLPTHSVFGDESGGVHFVDGRLEELAVDGRRAVWAEVVAWEPPDRLVMEWHPGRDEGPTSQVEVTFEPESDGTRVTIRHDRWETFGEEGMRTWRSYVGPSAWGSVLDHFADGAEQASDGPDLEALAAAYDELFTEAAKGGFGPAPNGQWNAEQVLAHVALTDLAMTAVAQALIHRGEPTFENHTCQDLANLAAVIEACDDLDGVITFGRTCATQAMSAVGRLDEEQRAHLVPCRMEHDGEVVLDDVRPWAQIAVAVQTQVHLPAHVGQLRDLRD